MTYLAQWFDRDLEVSEDDTAAQMEVAEQERIANLLATAITAQQIPRRLGMDANSEELALDKRRAKRVAHVAQQLLKSWGGDPAQANGAVRREAAVIEWRQWWEEQQTYLLNKQRYIATWALKLGQDHKWAKSALVRINNELQWLAYALRD